MTKTIGQYEIGELLGEGGLGQVHAAFDTVLQRQVAVKSLRPELLNDANFVERFRVEATSLARLNHPNITTIYSLIPDGKNLYMVMELVRGHTLDDILQKRNASIEIRESLAIISQAADGLAYAHSMGVIHRDIKPANLMIAENGVLKIMDFGIARVRGSQRLTRTGSIVGTLAYMAPEQLRGEEGDEASDIYSLAIVLYEMLSGSPPFSATSEYDLMQAQINERPQRLIPRVPGLESAVESALLRALAKKPGQRFPSARAFSDALGASALRLDAPKILHNDTRLLEIQTTPASIGANRSPFERLAASLPFAGSPALRAAALGGGGALAVGLAVIGFVLWPGASNPPPAPAPIAQTHPSAAPSGPQAPPLTPVDLPSTSPPANNKPAGNANNIPSTSTPTSLANVIQAANRGDAEAENELGYMYLTGASGLPRDETKALSWFQKAAAQNFAKAEVNLGDMYFYGLGSLDKSYLEALSWYLKAAEQKNAGAEFRLGSMFEQGFGTKVDPQQAVDYYRSAADQGYPDAENVLGYLYATGGDGLQKDDKQAVEWYRKAAEQGFRKAQKNLGDMYFRGLGVPAVDQKGAMQWYKKAADQGDPAAQFMLGYMYEKGLGTDQNNDTALDYYRKAAGNGNVDAQRAVDRLSAVVGGNK
jgi:eukaryotic-like serine/threonine-protein kinase